MDPRWAVPPDVLASTFEDEVVLLHLGTHAYYRLNETAAVAWNGFSRGCPKSEIVAQLCAAFTVAPDAAETELIALISELEQRQLIVCVTER